MKLKIKIGECQITKSLMPGQQDLYVSIRSGIKKVRSKVIHGSITPNYSQTVELQNDNLQLTVKVKDVGMDSCFGGLLQGRNPFNSLIAQTKIDVTRVFAQMEAVQGFYSLSYNNLPAGKIYLTITPISK